MERQGLASSCGVLCGVVLSFRIGIKTQHGNGNGKRSNTCPFSIDLTKFTHSTGPGLTYAYMYVYVGLYITNSIHNYIYVLLYYITIISFVGNWGGGVPLFAYYEDPIRTR